MPQKHPTSLRTFFATELWERYGFYVVQTLLALYLVLHLHWQDKDVYALVASFTALTYLSPVIGGWIADHLLGQKRAILSGALILFLSYVVLSYAKNNATLTAALAGIAVGTGLLKPNISSLLGNEYPVGSPNRENGFTIFYMGITSGIILGTTLPSYINQYFGWSVSFLSASIGMIIAASTFIYGSYYHNIKDYRPYQYQLKNIVLAGGLMLGLWVSAYCILIYPYVANTVFIAVVLLSLSYLLLCMQRETALQARKTATILLLCLISVAFWAFYFQMFLSLTLFIARVVKPTFCGLSFSPPYYVGVQSIGMILFGLLLARRKNTHSHPNENSRIGNKFVWAMVNMTLAYALIAGACRTGAPTALLSPLYILPAYLMISLAELLLSPVGLSAITVLASSKNVSTMMGIFFVSLGIGGFLSGKLANLTAIPKGETSVLILKAHYAASFYHLFIILLITTLTCLLLNNVIKRLGR